MTTMTEHREGRHAARPLPADNDGGAVGPGRTVGFLELYGRLLAAANDTGDEAAPGHSGDLPARRPTGPHWRVVADLGARPDVTDEPAGVGGASRVYRRAGVPLTAKAALLADLVPVVATSAAVYTAAVRDAGRGLAGMPTAQTDRQLGDVTVLASLHDLVTLHGADTTTPRAGPGPTPPVFAPDGRPASMFGHIFPEWGMTAEDVHRLPVAGWAANLLTVAGWTPSARAWSSMVAAQNAEAVGLSWGAATRRAIAAAGRTPARAPWDRRTDPGRHRAGLGYARRRRSPPGDGSHPR